MTSSERQKMIGGELYRADEPDLVAARLECQDLVRAFNAATEDRQRDRLLRELLGEVGERVSVQPPFACDYGWNITLADGVFVNYGAVVLDCAPVVVGAATQIGPGVQLLAADHPREPEARRAGLELARPVHIGENVWLGGAAIVCPGVTIGDDSVIGAGSVVTRDVPPGVVAAGNPCRVLRKL